MTDDIKQERDELATALRMTAKSCADHLNTIRQLRAELEAFKQEVSDAMEEYCQLWAPHFPPILNQFIIPAPKPDPLVEIIGEINDGPYVETKAEYADRIRAALEARGLEIRSKNDE
jgi:hypothetical protein